jgi:hypothetical protein
MSRNEWDIVLAAKTSNSAPDKQAFNAIDDLIKVWNV